jgi:protein-S-isoprenylcysteine O-methyltransferase Ste14
MTRELESNPGFYPWPLFVALINFGVLLPLAAQNMRSTADLWDYIFVLAGVYFSMKFVRYMSGAHKYKEARLGPRNVPKVFSKGIYKDVRHPVMAAVIYMNFAYLCFARSLALVPVVPVFVALWYILASWEESILLERFGVEYQEYMKTAGMFRGKGMDQQRLASSGYDMY